MPKGLERGETFFWKVKAETWRGDILWSSNVSGFYVREEVAPVEEKESLKKKDFQLKGNHPNPFNLSTTIFYTLNEA